MRTQSWRCLWTLALTVTVTMLDSIDGIEIEGTHAGTWAPAFKTNKVRADLPPQQHAVNGGTDDARTVSQGQRTSPDAKKMLRRHNKNNGGSTVLEVETAAAGGVGATVLADASTTSAPLSQAPPPATPLSQAPPTWSWTSAVPGALYDAISSRMPPAITARMHSKMAGCPLTCTTDAECCCKARYYCNSVYNTCSEIPSHSGYTNEQCPPQSQQNSVILQGEDQAPRGEFQEENPTGKLP